MRARRIQEDGESSSRPPRLPQARRQAPAPARSFAVDQGVIKLVHVGGSYSAIKDIADQATKDLGFTVEMQIAPHDALLNRLVTQPQSIDIADIEYFFQLHMLPRSTLHAIDLKKIKLWDKVVPIFTKGEYPDGRKVSTQGVLPFDVQYVEKPGDKK